MWKDHINVFEGKKYEDAGMKSKPWCNNKWENSLGI